MISQRLFENLSPVEICYRSKAVSFAAKVVDKPVNLRPSDSVLLGHSNGRVSYFRRSFCSRLLRISVTYRLPSASAVSI